MKYEALNAFNGINRFTSPFLKPAEETVLLEAQNFVTDKIGVLKKSFDYQIKGAQITASKDILGGIDFYRNDGTHDHLVAIDGANSNIYYYTGGSWTSQSLSRTSGEKIRFAYSPTLDHLFACNIADATTGWTGSAWSTSTNLTNAPKANVVIVFGRRVYLLNVDVSATLYQDRAYRSSLVDSGSITWDVTNDWLTFDDVIIGAGKNGENMFVGCANGIWILTLADEKYQVSTIGCVSHESIASYDRWTFWAAEDGIYAFDGGAVKKISLPIQDYWDGIAQANKANIQMKIDGHKLVVWLGDLTAPETLTNVIFVYDILKNNWNRGSLVDNVTQMHTYTTSSGPKVFIGNDDGEVFQLFTSGTQNTAVYTTFAEMDWFYGSGPNVQDDYKEFWGYGDKLSGLKVYYKADDMDGYEPIGELNGGTDFVKFNKRAYRIKFMVEETSKDNMFEVHGFDVGYVPQYIKQEDTND